MGNVIEDAYKDALTHDCPNGCAKAGTTCDETKVCATRIGGGA